jgi:hypothetical protein
MITGSETTPLVSRQLPAVLEPRLPLIPAPDVLTLGLREDQVVRPLVTVQSDALKLVLQGRVFDPPAGMRLVAGESPLMRVHLLPGGGAILRLAEAPAPAAPQSLAPLRLDRLLHMPASVETLLQALRPGVMQQWLAPALASNPQVGALLQLFLRVRPGIETLDGPGLRQAILASGFFTETQLLRKSGAPSDLKSVLRQLIEQLQSDHTEASAKLTEVVDEIEAFQLQTLQSDPARPLPLQLVLAFGNGPPVQLTVHRDRPGKPREQSAWDVDLYTRSEAWGQIWLRTRVIGTDRVGLTMWAEREDIYTLAVKRGHLLRESLREAQLTLNDFRVIHGQRPDSTPPSPAGGPGRLIDCEA